MNVVPDDEGNNNEFVNTNEETIKEMINREYQFYFKRPPEKIDLYRLENAFFKRPVINEMNRKFRVEFASSKIL